MGDIAGDGTMSDSSRQPKGPPSPSPPSSTEGQGDDRDGRLPVARVVPEAGTSRNRSGSPGPPPATQPPPSTPRQLKGILKNKQERSPVAPNAFNYQGPEPSVANVAASLRDNNTVEEERFSRVVDSKALYARHLAARKKDKYSRARYKSTDDLPPTFRPKRRDEEDPDEDDGHSKKPPVTA